MDEAKAAAYYDEVKAKGSGAHMAKQGLGYGGHPSVTPSAPPSQPLPRVPGMHPGGPVPPFAGAPMPPPGMRLPWPPPPPPPHMMGGPPGMMAPMPYPPYPPYPGMPPPHPYGLGPPVPPVRPPMPPHPGMAPPLQQGLPPPPHGLPPMQPQPPPPRPAAGAPVPPASTAGAAPSDSSSAPAQQQQASDSRAMTIEEIRKHNEQAAARVHAANEEAAARVAAAAAAAAAARDEAERKRAVDEAWTAHKSADSGKVYYYNTVTQESSWVRPAGFRGSEDVAEGRPVPVAQAPVHGTDWSEVKCQDGRTYFFNSRTQATSWTVPEDVAAAKQRAKDEAVLAAARARQQAAQQVALAQEQARRAAAFDAEAARRQHIASLATAKGSKVGQLRDAAGEKERALGAFKQLLLDKGVNGFSFFDKMVPKLQDDERWDLIPNVREKRAIFEDFCKNIGAEQKKLAAEKGRAALEGFRALLEEAAALERRLRQQELAEARARAAADQEEGEAPQAAASTQPTHAGPSGDSNGQQQQGQQGEEGIPQLLGQEGEEGIPDHELGLTLEVLERYWSNDERWGAVSAEQRALLHRGRFGLAMEQAAQQKQAEREAREAGFRALLKELGVTGDTAWGEVSGRLAGDARGAAIAPAERESLFRAYIQELKDAAAHAAAAEREAAEQQREAARRLEAQGEEADRRRRRAAAGDAAVGFRALLGEVVKDPEAEWSEWLPRLTRDPQGRASNDALPAEEHENLFHEHIDALAAATTAALREALAEVLKPLTPAAQQQGQEQQGRQEGARLHAALRRYSDAEALLGDHAKWASRIASEQFRERVWREWVDEVVHGRPAPAPLRSKDRHRQLQEPLGHDDRGARNGMYGREGMAYGREGMHGRDSRGEVHGRDATYGRDVHRSSRDGAYGREGREGDRHASSSRRPHQERPERVDEREQRYGRSRPDREREERAQHREESGRHRDEDHRRQKEEHGRHREEHRHGKGRGDDSDDSDGSDDRRRRRRERSPGGYERSTRARR